MSHRFSELMFTPGVKALQEVRGSRASYAKFERPESPARDHFTDAEAAFIAARDSFYMATVSETGWPYVQHRGGPAGFLKLLDDRTLGFADYRGNRQYVSVGNLGHDDRVSLFLMDYPNQRRLKILGHARIIESDSNPDVLATLQDRYPARIERGIIIELEGFDWNCPQHITPRFSEAEVRRATEPLLTRLAEAEAEVKSLRAALEERR